MVFFCFVCLVVSGEVFLFVVQVKGSLHGADFCIEQNTSVVVRPSFYMTTACWRP